MSGEDRTFEVTQVNQFAEILSNWHATRVTRVRQLLEVPDGTVMKVGEDKEIVLTGDVLTGLKTGVEMALMELGELPFKLHVGESTAQH